MPSSVAAPGARERRGRAAPRPRGELCLVFTSGPWLLSMPAAPVERLLLAEEVRLEPGAGPGQRVLVTGKRRYALWSLSALFRTGAPVQAFIALRLRFQGRDVPLALGVTRCMAVQPLSVVPGLSPALFQGRPAAFAGVFDAAASAVSQSLGPVGLALDPSRLWTVEELEGSLRLLEGATEGEA